VASGVGAPLEAVNEVNLPLHFHTFPTMPPSVREKATGLTKRAALFTSVSGFQMNLINILAAVIGSAVLERYPNIRISFGRAASAGCPMRSIAWTSSGRTASTISGSR